MRESPNFIGLRVIGSRYSPDTFRVRDFLARNRVLFSEPCITVPKSRWREITVMKETEPAEYIHLVVDVPVNLAVNGVTVKCESTGG
jgi:hypothetical protein